MDLQESIVKTGSMVIARNLSGNEKFYDGRKYHNNQDVINV
jgi:hypothetical protein